MTNVTFIYCVHNSFLNKLFWISWTSYVSYWRYHHRKKYKKMNSFSPVKSVSRVIRENGKYFRRGWPLSVRVTHLLQLFVFTFRTAPLFIKAMITLRIFQENEQNVSSLPVVFYSQPQFTNWKAVYSGASYNLTFNWNISYTLTCLFAQVYANHRMTLASKSFDTLRNAMYCFTPSILFWNSTRATFILDIMLPILPTIVAKIRTPAKKSATTNKYSRSFSGCGVSPVTTQKFYSIP